MRPQIENVTDDPDEWDRFWTDDLLSTDPEPGDEDGPEHDCE